MVVEIIIWLSCSLALPDVLPYPGMWLKKNNAYIYETADWRVIVRLAEPLDLPKQVIELDPNAIYRHAIIKEPLDSPPAAREMMALVAAELVKHCGNGVLESPEGFEKLE